MKTLFGMIVVGVGLLLWQLESTEREDPVTRGFEIGQPQAERTGAERKLDDEAKAEAVENYRRLDRRVSSAERCRMAGDVAAAFLQAEDDNGFARWKTTEQEECTAASRETAK